MFRCTRRDHRGHANEAHGHAEAKQRRRSRDEPALADVPAAVAAVVLDVLGVVDAAATGEARGEVDGGAAEGEARWYGRQRTMG